MGISSFATHKISVARRLANGECGGTYSDACILISALISGAASLAWPGRGNDHKRFVEAWVRFADPALSPAKISIPLLAGSLKTAGQINEVQTLTQKIPLSRFSQHDARIVTAADVDRDELEVVGILPSLSAASIRRHSYPSVFYREVRSSLSHECELSPSSAAHPQSIRQDAVSYVNYGSGPNRQRKIHFHIEWLCAVAQSIADSLAPFVQSNSRLNPPSQWWLP
jgi:hypothetical protein